MELFDNWHRYSQGYKKKVPILEIGGPAPAPPTLPVIRVVLLHVEAFAERLLRHGVCKCHFVGFISIKPHPVALSVECAELIFENDTQISGHSVWLIGREITCPKRCNISVSVDAVGVVRSRQMQ